MTSKSHPLRVRELKRETGGGNPRVDGSHPLRVRELKLIIGASQEAAESRTLYGCVN